jgi:tetratricopeptide (TPR) repeat protein
MPPGIELALSGRQAILKYEHARPAYRQKLLNAVAELTREQRTQTTEPKAIVANRMRPAYWAIAAFALIATGLVFFLYMTSGKPGDARRAEPLPLLVANFKNETGQAVFDGVFEEALKIAMEGAPFITSYPRQDARRVLTELHHDDTLTHDAARLVAVHEGLELVLAGSVRRKDGEYELRIDALDPVSGDTRVSSAQSAATPLDALNVIASMAVTLRRALGDTSKRQTDLEEIFTSSSMEAVSEFAKAQALAADWKHQEAVVHYERAVALDANFGRAYGGWAYSSFVLGQVEQSKALWEKCLPLIGAMTERERLRTLGVYYMTISGNVDKAIESYLTLIKQYPADAAALNNLAVAYFSIGKFNEARDAGARLLEIFPDNLLFLSNFALYNMYIADMEKAAHYAQRTLTEDPKYYVAYLPLAMQALLQTNYGEATQLYTKMAALGEQGASLAASGLGDIALGRGDLPGAIETLKAAAAADTASGNHAGANTKRLWLAHAQLASGSAEQASKTLSELSATAGTSDRDEVERAELLIAMGDRSAAAAAADRLAAEVPGTSRAFGALIRAELALADGDQLAAIDQLQKSIAFQDNWLARYRLGTTYEQAGYHVEAMDELDLAWRRRGEGLAVFLDDVPSYHRLVDLLYWRARAQESIGMTEPAAQSYERFIKTRDLANKDAMVDDAAARLHALTRKPGTPVQS